MAAVSLACVASVSNRVIARGNACYAGYRFIVLKHQYDRRDVM